MAGTEFQQAFNRQVFIIWKRAVLNVGGLNHLLLTAHEISEMEDTHGLKAVQVGTAFGGEKLEYLYGRNSGSNKTSTYLASTGTLHQMMLMSQRHCRHQLSVEIPKN